MRSFDDGPGDRSRGLGLLAGHEFDVLAQPLPNAHDIEVCGIRTRAQPYDMRSSLRQKNGQHTSSDPSAVQDLLVECQPKRLHILPVVAPAEPDDRGRAVAWIRIVDWLIVDRARRSSCRFYLADGT